VEGGCCADPSGESSARAKRGGQSEPSGHDGSSAGYRKRAGQLPALIVSVTRAGPLARHHRAGLGPSEPAPRPVRFLPPSEAYDGRSYYGQPVVKAPPWAWPVKGYLVTGGVAGTAMTLAAAADLMGGPHLRPLVRTARPIGAAAALASAGLLVADLGRPMRLLHMYRVVRPTSAMSMGAFVLGGASGLASLSVLLSGRPGTWGTVGRVAGFGAGALGLPLAGYTGVLLSATAMPGWNIGADTLPPLFLASGAATTASAIRVLPMHPPAQRALAVLAVSSQAVELAAEQVHERKLAARPRVRAAYEPQVGWRWGRALTLTSLALTVLPGRRRAAVRVLSGVLGVAGSVMTKTAVFDAGMASARDPLAVPESGAAR
jgi:hypothetical protein